MTDMSSPPPIRRARPDRAIRRVRGPLLAGVAILALAAACTGGSESPSAGAPGTAAPASPAPSASGSGQPGLPSATPVGPGAVPPEVIEAAVADAADRAGIVPTAAIVVVAEARDFPDGALGCPEPGMLYTQVITPGYRVVVEADGQRYDYRAPRRGPGNVRYCERPLEGG